MINVIKKNFFALFAILSLFSCAKNDGDDSVALEEEALSEWMTLNHPDIPKVDDGLYYKIYRLGTEGEKPEANKSWVYITSVGKDLEGNYFINMYPDIARRLGTYKALTHYAPDVFLYRDDSNLTTGIFRALSEMNAGDSVEIYCSSRYAFGNAGISSINVTGFEGNTTISGGRPVYRTVKLNYFTDDPVEYSKERTLDYAVNKLGKLASDSIKDGLYMKFLTSKVGDKITEDEEVQVYYTGRYLDGKVFDTNVASVAKANDIYDSSKAYTSMSFKGSDNSFVSGFSEAILNMRKGEKATVVFYSEWGYGGNGSNSNGVYIRPFEPLVFDIEVLEEEE